MTNALFSTQHLLSDLPEKIGKYPVVGTAGRGNKSASQDSSLGDSGENPTDTDAPEIRLS